MPIRTDLINTFYNLNSLCDNYEDIEVRMRLHHIKTETIKGSRLESKQVRDGCCACMIY